MIDVDNNGDQDLKERPLSLYQAAAASSTSSSLPSFPSEIKKLSELTDGVGLCAVVSLYCPNDLPWTDVALGEPPSMADSLYNIQVGFDFLSCGEFGYFSQPGIVAIHFRDIILA